MKLQPPKMVWTDPVIGYRQFADRICRAIFEDSTGQYVLGDGGDRIYGVWMISEKQYPLPFSVNGREGI